MSGRYVLDGQVPREEPDLLTWANWFETNDRKVSRTELAPGLIISTIFLGLDHSFGFGPPLLFETMSFSDYDGGGELVYCRYSTWGEAELGHMEAVERLQAQLGPSGAHADA